MINLNEFSGVTYIAVDNRRFVELNPLSFGAERCLPGKFFGPARRDHYLIHFIYRGTGVFENPRGRYEVKEGEAFLIRPGEICKYTASEDNPWVYIWVGFVGRLAERYDAVPDVFSFNMESVAELSKILVDENGLEERLCAFLFSLTADMAPYIAKNDKIKQVYDFVDVHYMHPMHVEDIADALHVNRKYLARIFKERTGQTVKEYITERRLYEAEKLLRDGRGVAETAMMVGYTDGFNFSKAFKKKYGVPPKSKKR
ncbi:MAG: AraC family transcriptional regulator [Oscillospiraceae bacterium]|nr:AraC family transcriptional regulator [Oscillospiraceae bacterium]